MTPLPRKACPRCQRTVAWRVVRGPRVNRGRPIPPLMQPVAHKRHILGFGDDGRWEWCQAGDDRR